MTRKPTAAPDTRSSAGGGFGASLLFLLAALLVAPLLAVLRSDVFGQPHWILAAGVLVSFCAFVLMWIDKRRAESAGWRVPENFLHLLELLGGWPGSFIAQRLFRHKTSKLSYQIVFWVTVFAYELISVDFLLGWKMAAQIKVLIGIS